MTTTRTERSLAELVRTRPVERLAVLAGFDPERVPGSAELEPLCDELQPVLGRRQQMLRESLRVRALARALRRGGRQELLSLRAETGAAVAYPSPMQLLLDAVLADQTPSIDALDEDGLVAALHIGRWLQHAAALAGRFDVVPPQLARDPIDGRLALIDTTRPVRELTQNGCVGRDAELRRLREFVAAPSTPGSYALDALQVFGIGGIGKSTLVAQFVVDLADGAPTTGSRIAWAYLDLDRPTLSSYEEDTIIGDIVRQVGAQLPDARRYLERSKLELSWSTRGQGLESAGFSEAWRDTLPVLAQVVHDFTDGRLVVVLDTMEELQRDQPERVIRLSDMFRAVKSAVPGLRLVISGRAPVTEFLDGRPEQQLLQVREFYGAAATELLRHFYDQEQSRRQVGDAPGAPTLLYPQLSDRVVNTVGGSPLSLKIAARVLAEEGLAGITSAADRARTLDLVRSEFIRGFLYHRILDHLGGSSPQVDSPLPAIARASLALRVLTPDLLGAVVLPAINRPDLDPGVWYGKLQAEQGLAYAAPDGLRIRDELRAPALLALSYEEPDLVQRLHLAAAAYYAEHPGLPDAAAERAYHQLAAGLSPEDLAAGLDGRTARDVSASHDLSTDSRQLLAAADSLDLQAALNRRSRERQTESAAEVALAHDAPDEAAKLLSDRSYWSPGTTLYRLVAQAEEALGNGDAARRAARRDIGAAVAAASPERYAAAVVRSALLEERYDYGPLAAVGLEAAFSSDLLAGHTALRLQIHLCRMALLERIGQDGDRWVDGLDARILLQSMPPAQVAADTALTRLLAATLGRDEPSWLRTAVREIGLATADPAQVRAVTNALGDWDAGQPSPGELARTADLQVGTDPSRAELRHAWFQGLAGLGTSAGLLLDRVWSRSEPPESVRHELRSIYLWWGVTQRGTGVTAAMAGAAASTDIDESPVEEAEGRRHFLDQDLDFGDQQLQELARTIARAYPTVEDLQVVASRSGLSVSGLNWKQPPDRLARQVLSAASEHNLLPDLVQAVVSDPDNAYLQGTVKDVVGSAWLDEHHIT